MDFKEAEKILNKYGDVIAQDKNHFKKESTLPCSKAKIRQAFFVYIPAILDEMGYLPSNIGGSIVTTYSMLDAFVKDEEAEKLNRIPLLLKENKLDYGKNKLDYDKPEDKQKIDDYFSRLTKALCNREYFNEINSFITECYKERGIDPGSRA
jgi:hypothetical protein